MEMARKKTDVVQLKLRFSETLRRRLEREAKQQKQSLNGEIISRLEQSFRKAEDTDLIARVLGGMFGATGGLLNALVTAIWLIEKRTGKQWNKDPDTSQEVRDAADFIIDALVRPEAVFEQATTRADDLMRQYEMASKAEVFEAVSAAAQRALRARGAALEALQRMGLAPSDAEIANVVKKIQAQKAAAGPQVQETEKK